MVDTATPLRPVAASATISDRVKRLQAEARALAREHVSELQARLADVGELAAQIAAGGEAYPAGVREIARRLVEETTAKNSSIAMIGARQ
jgi:hypothetical protein